VRGGGGTKFLCKKITFNDFVDVARWLVEDTCTSRKLTSPAQLSCEGRSAGGLLIGASVDQAPGLFGVAILGVPFVDVVPTMIDASIPYVQYVQWSDTPLLIANDTLILPYFFYFFNHLQYLFRVTLMVNHQDPIIKRALLH